MVPALVPVIEKTFAIHNGRASSTVCKCNGRLCAVGDHNPTVYDMVVVKCEQCGALDYHSLTELFGSQFGRTLFSS
jgi:hypothetical protein